MIPAIPAPPKYRGSISHIIIAYVLCVFKKYYYVRRRVLFKIHTANIEASEVVVFCR